LRLPLLKHATATKLRINASFLFFPTQQGFFYFGGDGDEQIACISQEWSCFG
jgi:aspartate/tyrosine/aromatic aminotransferase